MSILLRGLGGGSTVYEQLLHGLRSSEPVTVNPAQTARWIALAAHFRARAVTVTYGRGGDTVDVSALVGNTTDDRTEDDHATHSTARDFIIKAATLQLSGATVTPARGDTITIGGNAYQVLPLAGSTVARNLDPRGVYLRIHTRRAEAWTAADTPADTVTQQSIDAALRLSGVAVEYLRGAARVGITALVGRTQDDETPGAWTIEGDTRDYLFRLTDLSLAGSATVPQRGDVIRLDGVNWQVLPIDGSDVWRPADPRAYLVRVRTRKTTAGGVG